MENEPDNFSTETFDSDTLPILVRQNAIDLDDIDPHWTWYQTDKCLDDLKKGKPAFIRIPPGSYMFKKF
jgi:hypothetical protein